MIIDLNHYDVLLPVVRTFIANNLEDGTERLIARLVVMTSAPIIVITHFVGLVHGYDEIVNRKILEITDFYRYDNVIPLKPITIKEIV